MTFIRMTLYSTQQRDQIIELLYENGRTVKLLAIHDHCNRPDESTIKGNVKIFEKSHTAPII